MGNNMRRIDHLTFRYVFNKIRLLIHERRNPTDPWLTSHAVELLRQLINQEDIQSFINNDSTQWFDIIASFAIFLGALNMIKLQIVKIIKKQKNWQYSILAVGGFFFAIFAGFIFRGSNYIVLHDIPLQNQSNVAIILSDQLQSNVSVIEGKISSSNGFTPSG